MAKRRVYLGHIAISSLLYQQIKLLMEKEGETKVLGVIALCVKRELERRKK
jgi:hypothetical protein